MTSNPNPRLATVATVAPICSHVRALVWTVRPGQFGWFGLNGVQLMIDRAGRLGILLLTQLLHSFYMPEVAMVCVGPPGALYESIYADLEESGMHD